MMSKHNEDACKIQGLALYRETLTTSILWRTVLKMAAKYGLKKKHRIRKRRMSAVPNHADYSYWTGCDLAVRLGFGIDLVEKSNKSETVSNLYTKSSFGQ